MAKLQLYINKSLRGYKNVVNINDDSEVRHLIHDFRHALGFVDYDNSHVNVFYLLRYIESGMLLSVLSTIPGREKGDHTAATMFLPLGVKISPADIISLCEAVATAIDSGERDPQPKSIDGLRELFGHDYEVNPDAPARVPSHGRDYACAEIGSRGLRLADYVKSDFYVYGYVRYAGVLLLEPAVANNPRTRLVNLTPDTLPEVTTLLAPAKTPEGFTAYIYDRPFNRAYVAPIGEPITLHWRKAGFESIKETFRLNPAPVSTVPLPDTSGARKTITTTSVYITDATTRRPVGTFMLKVNGVNIDEPHDFTYAELTEAKVEVNSPGYFAYSGTLDLASTAQGLVQMKPLHRTYRFDLPVISGQDTDDSIRIYLKTRNSITASPIEGYAVAGGDIIEGSGVSNKLYYIGSQSRDLIKKGIAAGIFLFLFGILLGWLMSGGCSQKQSNPAPVVIESTQAQAEPAQTAAEPVVVSVISENTAAPDSPGALAAATPAEIAEGVAYLQSNKVWRRADMEAMPALVGLYDDINAYRFDRLRELWQPRLEGSVPFAAIMKAVHGAESASKRNPATGEHSPLFVNDDSQAINWRMYTFWVDP